MDTKIKYLVERKHIDPSKIVVISYTNKATDELEDRIKYKKCPNAYIEVMSIHKSKGLGADQVIILNVTNKNFPEEARKTFWIKNLFDDHEFVEKFPDAEERRVFYVALTRTKKDVYLLTPREKSKESPFVRELLESEI